MTSRRAPALAVLAVALGAAAWFWPGIWLTLEWVDQGQIVYGAWRVARGELPYRDFDHLYGPSIFFLNGALLRWFGEDLAVLRIGLLVVKAALAALVFVVARNVARPAIALAVTVWFVAQWGVPIWIYATPYAGHYTLACCLVGLGILFGGVDWRRAALAGLCVGVGAGFKHTTGLFLALAALVALAARPVPGSARDGLATLGRSVRALAALGASLVVMGYLWTALDTLTGAALLTAPLFGLAWEWRRDRPRERALPGGGERAATTIAFGLGFALPLIAWAAFYGAHGAFGDLVHDALLGLPQLVVWKVTLLPPHPLTLAFGSALAVTAFGLATGRAPLVVLGGLANAALFVAVWLSPAFGILGVQTVLFLPLAVLWASAPIALRRADRDAPRLVWWFGAMGCLGLHPAADLAHALMILPVIAPLLALLVDDAWTRARVPLARAALAALVGFPMLVRVLLDVGTLRTALAAVPPNAPAFDRATRIWEPTPQFAAMHSIVADLDRLAPRGRPLLVLPTAQLLYVLADRPSALPHAEMILYLTATGIMTPEDARALLAEPELVARLEDARPPIVRTPDAAWTRLAVAFPALAAWIDAHYDVAATHDGVQLLVPRA